MKRGLLNSSFHHQVSHHQGMFCLLIIWGVCHFFIIINAIIILGSVPKLIHYTNWELAAIIPSGQNSRNPIQAEKRCQVISDIYGFFHMQRPLALLYNSSCPISKHRYSRYLPWTFQNQNPWRPTTSPRIYHRTKVCWYISRAAACPVLVDCPTQLILYLYLSVE